jgi:hypothetical protein
MVWVCPQPFHGRPSLGDGLSRLATMTHGLTSHRSIVNVLVAVRADEGDPIRIGATITPKLDVVAMEPASL